MLVISGPNVPEIYEKCVGYVLHHVRRIAQLKKFPACLPAGMHIKRTVSPIVSHCHGCARPCVIPVTIDDQTIESFRNCGQIALMAARARDTPGPTAARQTLSARDAPLAVKRQRAQCATNGRRIRANDGRTTNNDLPVSVWPRVNHRS